MTLALRYIVFSGIVFMAPSIFYSTATAQERCATVEYSKSLYPDYTLRRIQFEQWIADKKVPRTSRQQREKQTMSYKIPVVVHIIHNGEPVGTGTNISDAQILSQIRVLNEDFTRQNADAANTPSEFASVAGSLDIEFVLAKQDPDGLPTNGIVRIDGGRNGWVVNDNYAMKALSYWPAEQYMNIWVCNLVDEYVGYAQHPVSDLEGLENSSTNRLTDGVVIWHRAFGSIDDGSFNLDPTFNKGRTATHEVGHFFGLFHVWGDEAGCSGSDFVDDTPNQYFRTQGCPTHPRTDSCGEVVMFQNFLDYTDDVCMNLFTEGQVQRMEIVIENSPRRSTLLTSPGLEDPEPLANDIGIRAIIFPDAAVCSQQVTPVIEVRNYGSNAITSARIRFMLDGAAQETLDFPLSLDPDESAQVSFSPLTISSGSHDISFQVLLTNGGADAGSYNNMKISTVVVPVFSSVPFTENFTTTPAGWITQNFDGQITWSITTAPQDAPNNKALGLNYFNYEDKIGEIDVFLSPVFDLTSAPAATLTFDVAHARYQASNDRLRVVVLTSCQSLFEGTTVYDKAGSDLQTAPATTSPFTPANETQWRRELIDLNAFIGLDKVQIAFVGINDWGNNIYLDNVSFSIEERHDIALVSLVAPSPVTCQDEVTPVLLVENPGSVPIGGVTVEYSVNEGPIQSTTIPGLNIGVATDREITLPQISLAEGENTLLINVIPAGSAPDDDESNNQRAFVIVTNDNRDRIPLRENFENDFTPMWTIVNPSPDGSMNWQTIPTNFGESLYYNAFDNQEVGEESWFVSPVLDFSRTGQASMLFDLSYNPPAGGPTDRLTILASKDCGTTFEEVPFDFPDTGFSEESWIPTLEQHWSTNVEVDLTSFAGEENVRIAFVASNENGNNLYIDNIEFFVSSDPNAIEIPTLYSIYGYDLDEPQLSDLQITFNLDQRQDVRFSVINVMGQMETDGIITDVLNQTFPLNLRSRLAPGVYFIRLQIAGRFYSTKILVDP